MRVCARLSVLALLPAGAATPLPAQDVAAEAKVELVQVDVVVIDAHGKLVQDLTQQDFEVLEDGKPQRLTHFVVAGKTAAAAAPVAAAESPAAGLPVAPAPAAEPRQTASGPGRQILIAVDDLHIAVSGVEYAKQALKRLLDEFAAAGDNVALVTTSPGGVVQQFTRDREVLKKAIDRLSSRQAGVTPVRISQMTPAQAELILSGDHSALELAGRTMVAEPGGVLDNSPQAAVQGAVGALDPADAKQRWAETEAKRQARGVLAEALVFSTATLGRIDDVLRNMAPLPGRKICLLISDGFLVGAGTSEERTRDLQRIADAATRSGAVVYTLDSRGLVPTGGDAGVGGGGVAPGLQSRVERQTEQLFRGTLKTVADMTGGFLVQGTNDFASGLRRMLEDNETYYLMAYEPSNPKRDGRFRKLDVRLPRHADFAVRTRKGYFAPDERKNAGNKPADAAAPRTLDEAEARAALDAPMPTNGIPVRLAADYVDLPPAGPQALIRARVDVAGLHWRKAEGRQQASVELLAGVYDASGKPVGRPFGRRADLDLKPAEQKRIAEAGLQYQQQLPLAPGRYQVRLIAREQESAQLGGATQWLEIPDLAEKTLTLSSMFLSASAPTSASATPATPAGSEALRDAQTQRRFKRSESVYFQLYVYNVLADETGASDVVLQAQIRSGPQVIAASKPQPVVIQAKDGVPLPQTNGMGLTGLTPGTYELRVVVVDRKANTTAYRSVDFTLE